MAWLYNGLSNLFKNRKIDTTYDKCNSEALNILEIDNFSGIKTELSKTISNNLQLSFTSFLNADRFLKNTFCTFCTNNSLFQFSFDQNKNIQLQGTHLYKRIVTKFNTVYSEDKNIFSQVNIEINNRLNNLCLKLIKPAIKGASFIYIFNYMQQLGNASLGAEIISSDSYYSLSFAGRYKKNNSIGSISLQHFNTLSLDFYRKINDILEIGLCSTVSKDKSYSYGLGCKVNSNRSEIKAVVDNTKKIRFSLIDKLSEGLSLNMNLEAGIGEFAYGYEFVINYPKMQKKNAPNDISAMLRTKYINNSLDESLKLTTHYPLFTQLGGVGYLHRQVIDFIYNPLFKKDEYKRIGVFPPSTLLIYGASGVGKSFIINCISQEYKIPILHGNYDSDREIREVFRKADAKENCILLFDRIDNISEENEQKVISQLSECLNNHKSRAIVIAVAENPINIHQSLRKFDNEILIRIPNIQERKEICTALLKNVNHSLDDIEELSRITPGYVPRDLKRMVKLAASISIADNRIKISLDDFKEAADQMKKIESSITFDNIGALEEVKDELLMSIVLPSRYPDKFKRLGIVKPSGILLHGPPGCGKTLLARAVSNMSHCNFISVKGPELISKYVGDSEKEIRKLFDRAKQLQPCVVFFDEIDSLCSKRKGNEFGNRIVNQILTLLDGLDDRGEVYMIGATNRLSTIDKALLRPGRFDKIIEVPLPNSTGCVDVFLKCINGIPIEDFSPHDLPLEGFSGADIAGIVKEAALFSLKEDFESQDAVITKQNFIDSINKYRLMKKRY